MAAFIAFPGIASSGGRTRRLNGNNLLQFIFLMFFIGFHLFPLGAALITSTAALTTTAYYCLTDLPSTSAEARKWILSHNPRPVRIDAHSTPTLSGINYKL
jgi:hypothetical protein